MSGKQKNKGILNADADTVFLDKNTNPQTIENKTDYDSEVIERLLSKKIEKLEEDYKMPYVTSWERIAKKEGIREGIREGIKEGIREGIREGKKEGIMEGKKEGIMEGKREGKREGMEAKAKETAKKMLEDGMPIENISKYTGLTEKEINALLS